MTAPSTLPRRVQRERRPGWQMPDGSRYVGRPTVFGNPYRFGDRTGLARVPAVDGSTWEYEDRISAAGTRHDAHHPDGSVTVHHIRYMTRSEIVNLYARSLITPTPQLRLWRRGAPGWYLTVDQVRADLAGLDLACWCRPEWPCHADVLLHVANSVGEVSWPWR